MIDKPARYILSWSVNSGGSRRLGVGVLFFNDWL